MHRSAPARARERASVCTAWFFQSPKKARKNKQCRHFHFKRAHSYTTTLPLSPLPSKPLSTFASLAVFFSLLRNPARRPACSNMESARVGRGGDAHRKKKTLQNQRVVRTIDTHLVGFDFSIFQDDLKIAPSRPRPLNYCCCCVMRIMK